MSTVTAQALQNMPKQQPPMNLNNIRMNVGGQAVLPAHTNLLSTQLKLQQIQQNLALQIEKSLAPALAEAARHGHSLKDLLESDNPSLEPLKKLYSLLSEHPLSLGITLPGMEEGKGGLPSSSGMVEGMDHEEIISMLVDVQGL